MPRRPGPRLHGHAAGRQRLLRDPGQVARRWRPAEGHAARRDRITAHDDHGDPGRRHAQDVRRQRPAHGGCVVGRGQVDALRQLDPSPRAAAERDEQQRVTWMEPDEVGQGGEQLARVAQPGDRRGGRGGRSRRAGRCHAARLTTAGACRQLCSERLWTTWPITASDHGDGAVCGQLCLGPRTCRRPVLTSPGCQGVIGVASLGADVHIRRRERDESVYDYDLLVIGSGPGGQKAAIAAAKLGKRVAVAERRDMMGGVCVNTGTIPSKTLREAVLYLTGFAQRDMYGASYRVKSEITIGDLLARTAARRRARGGGHPQPAAAQPRRHPRRHGALRRPAHRHGARRRPR